jgi:hypothetical protein
MSRLPSWMFASVPLVIVPALRKESFSLGRRLTTGNTVPSHGTPYG